MKLLCPHCGADVPASSINIHEMVAICAACNHLFKFEAPSTPRQQARRVTQPDTIAMDWTQEAFVLRLRWSWRTERKYLLVLMGGWLVAALLMTGSALGRGEIGLVLVALLVALLPCYYFAMLAVNTLRLFADGESLRVWDAPLPWVHNVALDLSAIEDLEVVVSHHSDPSEANPYFDVQARVRDGRARRLVEFVPERHALYIEQQLRAYLARHYADDEDSTLRLAYHGDEADYENGWHPDEMKRAVKR
jgi:hypothetical protein